jgi:hypothetical protein
MRNKQDIPHSLAYIAIAKKVLGFNAQKGFEMARGRYLGNLK